MVMKPGYKSVYPVPAIRGIHRLHGYLYLLFLRKGMLGPYGLVRFRFPPNVIPHARPIRGKIGKVPLSAFPADVRLLFSNAIHSRMEHSSLSSVITVPLSL